LGERAYSGDAAGVSGEGVGVLEVRSEEEARRLNDWLCDFPNPVGLDLETTGWSPDDGVSPVGRARVFVMTLAWQQTSCLVHREYLPFLRDWLECDRPQKVGTNLWGFDRHALRNEGIELSGILADTALMSRLMDSRPDIDEHGGHSLEAWGARIGHNKAGTFEELVTVERLVTVPGKVKQYKRESWAPRAQVLWPTLRGGEYQEVRFKVVVQQLGQDEVWRDTPERREAIKQYACTDPVVSLRVYEKLKKRMEGRRW
jgi:hypothetical protein